MALSLNCFSFFSSTSIRRRQYRSEYRVRYRPFSQYEYVDGRFIPSPGAGSPTIENVSIPKSLNERGDPWYTEVTELRKQANNYKVGNHSQ